MNRRLLGLLMAAPWLAPFTPPPSSYTTPWVVTGMVTGFALLLAAGVSATSRQDWLEAMAWGCTWAGVIAALIGLAQYHGVAAAWSDLTHGWINAGRPGEAYGHLRQRNLFASQMNITLAASTYLLLARRHRFFSLALSTWGLVAVLLIAANTASASRTGMFQLALLVLLIAVLAMVGRAGRLVLGLAVFAFTTYLLCIWLLPRYLGPAGALNALARMSESGGCESRLILWSNVLELIGQKPWLGWGWGELDWAHHMAVYRSEALGGPHRFCHLLDNAHNLFLHVAVEGGLVLCGLLSLALLFVVLHGKPWREHDPGRLLAWVILALIGFHSLLEYPLWYGPFVMTSACCLLILLWPANWPSRPTGRRITGMAGLLTLSCFVFIGWDYLRVSQYYEMPENRVSWIDTPPLSEAPRSWLFQPQLDFARLTTLQINHDNAAEALELAERVMHFSPEPRVIEQLLLAAMWLGDQPTIALHEDRYRQAFPKPYIAWLRRKPLVQSIVDARR